jgi:thermitase
VFIAIIDTGVASPIVPGYEVHPDLDGKVYTGRNFTVDPPDNVTTDNHDARGHGIQVAGVAAAKTNQLQPLGVAGVSWGNFIVPVKVCNETDGCRIDWCELGIKWAADYGAKVLNCSWGIYCYPPNIATAVEYARSKGCVVIASTGNANLEFIHYPSSL